LDPPLPEEGEEVDGEEVEEELSFDDDELLEADSDAVALLRLSVR
jgi:hypothetical protein